MTLFNDDTCAGRIYSSGWRPGEGGVVDVVEPATGNVLTQSGLAVASDVGAAARAARAAQVDWAARPAPERGEVVRRAADLVREHHDELVGWGMRECGAINGKADNEVAGSRGELLLAAGMTTSPYGELLPSASGRLSFARRVPIGVVGIITPWNFPLILALRAVGPALALGNAVLLKPDAQTPIFGGALIARLFEEAGLPEGVLHVLPGGAEAGEAIVTSPDVGMVSFTGSTTTGRRVAELAAAGLKKVSLELGGNNALIVLEDADLEAAVSTGSWGSFLHQGQICLTTGRHLVHESVAGDYVELLVKHADALKVGDPTDPDVSLGPVINQRQLDGIDRIVQDSIAAGARLRAGGEHRGLFYSPTVLDGVTDQMPAFTKEIFGPVAPVTVFSDDAEAVALANRTEYGLVAAIQTRSVNRGLAMAAQIRAGMVHINDTTVNDEPQAPFGGMGSSGNGGRHGGHANWDEFTQWQWVTARDEAVVYPF
jgi:benzaldehyde dehydrogenase (NAD)